jgi:hypothetical protein
MLCVVPCRLQLLAEYQCGLLASLQLLGLAVPDLAGCLDSLKSLALARAGLTQQEVRLLCVNMCEKLLMYVVLQRHASACEA